MTTRIILGDNPFFGINHRSSDKAKEYSSIKSDFSIATKVISKASALGINEFMVSTHSEMSQLLEITAQALAKENLPKPDICLVTPYAHKLNSLVAEKGILGLFSLISPAKLVSSASIDFLSYVFRQRYFPERLFRAFIKTELQAAEGFNVKYICLQNILTDLLLGLDRGQIFEGLTRAMCGFNAEPVFITMNPIEADRVLPKGVRVCFHYNINGFMVQPSLAKIQKFISTTKRPIWAMGIMASGAAEKDLVFDDPYLKYFEKILFATTKSDRLVEAVGKL
jgi:hypothetical protein